MKILNETFEVIDSIGTHPLELDIITQQRGGPKEAATAISVIRVLLMAMMTDQVHKILDCKVQPTDWDVMLPIPSRISQHKRGSGYNSGRVNAIRALGEMEADRQRLTLSGR